jgi:hypothetical protein
MSQWEKFVDSVVGERERGFYTNILLLLVDEGLGEYLTLYLTYASHKPLLFRT